MNRRKELAAELREESGASSGRWSTTLAEAADLIDPPEDGSTVEVIIHVRVDMDMDEWEYHAAGWGGINGHDPDARQCLDGESLTPRYSRVVARVPKPEPDAEVEGTVDS